MSNQHYESICEAAVSIASVLPFLPSTTWPDQSLLPNQPGIYFVINADHRLLYIGATVSIRQRWYKHRKENLMPSGYKLSWFCPSDDLDIEAVESELVELLKPEWNCHFSVQHVTTLKRIGSQYFDQAAFDETQAQRVRGKRGSLISAQIKRKKSVAKIKKAVSTLRSQGKRLSISAVAREAGLSRTYTTIQYGDLIRSLRE